MRGWATQFFVLYRPCGEDSFSNTRVNFTVCRERNLLSRKVLDLMVTPIDPMYVYMHALVVTGFHQEKLASQWN